jgi:hypothetical protein
MLLLQLWCETVTWSCPCYRTSPGGTMLLLQLCCETVTWSCPCYRTSPVRNGNMAKPMLPYQPRCPPKTLVFLEGARDFAFFNRVGHCSVSCVCWSQNIDCNCVQKIILVDPVSNSMVCAKIQFSKSAEFLSAA